MSRRRSWRHVAVSVLLGLVATAAPSLVADVERRAAAAAAPAARGGPDNTILVVVDDMRADEMRVLPDTRRWLGREGVRFASAYAPTPLCCPARATILTGQYAHNTGVLDNTASGPVPGGFAAFDDSLTLATVLDDAGVTTGYIGKYLNEYTSRYVPPGWDDWRASIRAQYRYRHASGPRGRAAYGGRTVYNMNGALVTRRGYETTVQTGLARRFIRRHADAPFFLTVNYLAPHGNVTAAPGYEGPIPHETHEHDFDGYRVPRTEAFNEADLTDKPSAMQTPRMSRAAIRFTDNLGEARLETLKSVDDGMRAIRAALRRAGILDRTNVMFVSDNGFMLGEHRWGHSKVFSYEPSARVPLLMAGPGVQRAGVVRRAPVGLHDIASTITRWFGLPAMPDADGLSLIGPSRTSRDILLQGSRDRWRAASYTGLRTEDDYKYIEYLDGGVELYNLAADPLEVTNLADRRRYADLQIDLAQRLAELRTCAGQTCQ